jgi:hypothetical protein
MGLVCSLNVGEKCTCLRLGDAVMVLGVLNLWVLLPEI